MDRCNELCTKDTTGACAVCDALAERDRFIRFWLKGWWFIAGIKALRRVLHTIVWLLSGEFLLTWPSRHANGGTLIVVRTLIVSFFLYVVALLTLALSEILDPATHVTSSMDALRRAVKNILPMKNTLPWCGAIFAAVYAALYARFAAQWTYLAGLYNQMKAIEAQITATATCDKRKVAADNVLVSWKAGFIEDADELHLALKPMFAALINTWSREAKVRREFVKYAPGGRARLAALLRDVRRVLHDRERKYKKGRLGRARRQTRDALANRPLATHRPSLRHNTDTSMP